MKELLIQNNEESYINYSSNSWHAPVGAIIAKSEFDNRPTIALLSVLVFDSRHGSPL